MKNKLVFIIPAGGLGSRLMPLTKECAKGCLPIYFNDNRVVRMIDLSLEFCKTHNIEIYININYKKESYNFLNKYPNVHIIDKSFDTLSQAITGCLQEVPKVNQFCVFTCDFLIPIDKLEQLIENKNERNIVVLCSENKIMKPLRNRTKEGLNTYESGQEVSDLGLRLNNIEDWLKAVDYSSKIGSDVVDDLKSTAKDVKLILFDNVKHIDMGTPNAYYEILMKLNKNKIDNNGNIVFPGAKINNSSKNVIALPNSNSENIILNNCIIPENSHVSSLSEVLYVNNTDGLFQDLNIEEYVNKTFLKKKVKVR